MRIMKTFGAVIAGLVLSCAAFAQTPLAITALDPIGEVVASGDKFIVVNVSDTEQGVSGSTRYLTTANIFAYTGAFSGTAAAIVVTDAAGDTTTFPCVVGSATGNLPCLTDADLSFDAATGTLTATAFSGPLTGTASGNIADAGTPTDNAVVRFDGTTGTAVQDSGITVADVTGSSVTLATTAGNALAVAATAPAAANGASQAGKVVGITASAAVASLDTAGAAAGGDVTITAGAAARLTSGNANGGNINLTTGAGIGTGTAGQVLIPAGVASAPGIALATDTDTGIVLGAGSVGLAPNGAARLTVTTTQITSTGIGILGVRHSGETVTTTKTPTAAECNELYENTGDADGAAITLTNDPSQGCCYLVAVDAAQTLTITPNTGESLYMGTDQCAVSMTANQTGATAMICAGVGGSGGKWMSFGASGWTCND